MRAGEPLPYAIPDNTAQSPASVSIPDPQLFESPTRIESDEVAEAYIRKIDFTAQKRNMETRRVNGEDWPTAKINFVEKQYKNWLILKRKYEHIRIVPSYQIDQFWHGHMLDTRAYHRDCQLIFGAYLHHFPYFGNRGDADKKDFKVVWTKVQELYELEFGGMIYDYDPEYDDE